MGTNKRRTRIRGRSYRKKVADINRIYMEHINDGLSNREILRRYIQPLYPICEATLYNLLKAEFKLEYEREKERERMPSLFDESECS